MQLSSPLNKKRKKKLKQTAIELSKQKYPYPSAIQAVSALMGIKINARHCWQHVAYLLNLIGLLPSKYSNLGFFEICKKISELSGVTLNNNYYYKQVYQILYDI